MNQTQALHLNELLKQKLASGLYQGFCGANYEISGFFTPSAKEGLLKQLANDIDELNALHKAKIVEIVPEAEDWF